MDRLSACAVCGSSERQLLFKAEDLLYGMAIQSQVVRCGSCGLVYLMPQPARPQDYYPGEYAPHDPESADIARSMWRRAGLLRKARVAQRYGRGAWLDIGCAAGEFLATMRGLGCGPLWGMDQSEQAVALAPAMRGPGADLYLLPEARWARRVFGSFANHLANLEPRRAHAVLVPRDGDQYLLSLRVPGDSPITAHSVCAAFGGGGRARAAGIDRLAQARLPALSEALSKAFAGPA